MARTKQTARRSTGGGIAPVRQRMPKAAATSAVTTSVTYSTVEEADEDDEEEVKREISPEETNGEEDGEENREEDREENREENREEHEAEVTPAAGPLQRVSSNQATRRSDAPQAGTNATETPSSRKRMRSHSENEADSERLLKRVRSSTVPDTLPTLADPREDVKVLRTHIKELHTFVQDAGVILRAPSSIRKHLDALENGSAVFAQAIREGMLDAVRGQLSGDLLSRALLPFVKEIRTLGTFPQSDAVFLAVDLVAELGEMSYGDLDTSQGRGTNDRASDVPADDLYCFLAKKRRRQDSEWNFQPVPERHEFSKQTARKVRQQAVLC
ncbi:hypothetical protein LTR56_005538 [Elasticomyces elasticus]|nr:hypothetical protein LTR22_017924 [Elasticomyces elasticus]KAK3651730.1 hypothetical protein LTR56_005538 [Elasticomyces elasticus]KAK4912854.1 hypothetical protein LTR49_018710 [Elasticomyces elasticus]KAK5769171.1 hypothetical protein LTS12_000522 [Elasticomyces elasticus]